MYGTARATGYGYSLWEFQVYGSFDTAAAAVPPTPRRASPATASSTENAGTPASAAVDGNTGTRWSSAASDPQWIYVDLGAPADRLPGRAHLGGGVRHRVPAPGVQRRRDLDVDLLDDDRHRRHPDPERHRHRPLRPDVRHRAGHRVRVLPVGVRQSTRAAATTSPTSATRRRPPARPVATGGGQPNIALYQPVQASSYEGGNAPAAALDGRTTTRWSSLFTDPQWIYVDLGGTAHHHPGRAQLGVRVRHRLPHRRIERRHHLDDHLHHDHGQGRRRDPATSPVPAGTCGCTAPRGRPATGTRCGSSRCTAPSTPRQATAPHAVRPDQGAGHHRAVPAVRARPTTPWSPTPAGPPCPGRPSRGAAHYQVWINISRTDYDFTQSGNLLDLYTKVAEPTGTSYTPTWDITDRWTYKWFVVSVSGSGATTTSNIRTFSLYLPNVETVADGVNIVNGARDLNKDGTIEPYEDWHQPVDDPGQRPARPDDAKEKAYQMFYNAQVYPQSGWHFGPAQPIDLNNVPARRRRYPAGHPVRSRPATPSTGTRPRTRRRARCPRARTMRWTTSSATCNARRSWRSVPAACSAPLAEVGTKVIYPRIQEGNGENADVAAAQVRALVAGSAGRPGAEPEVGPRDGQALAG